MSFVDALVQFAYMVSIMIRVIVTATMDTSKNNHVYLSKGQKSIR